MICDSNGSSNPSRSFFIQPLLRRATKVFLAVMILRNSVSCHPVAVQDSSSFHLHGSHMSHHLPSGKTSIAIDFPIKDGDLPIKEGDLPIKDGDSP